MLAQIARCRAGSMLGADHRRGVLLVTRMEDRPNPEQSYGRGSGHCQKGSDGYNGAMIRSRIALPALALTLMTALASTPGHTNQR